VFSVLEQGVDEEAIQAFVATYDLDPWVGEARDRERERERESIGQHRFSTDSAQIQQILTDFNSTTALVQHLFGLLVSGFSNAIPFSTWKPQHFSFQN